MMILVGSLKMFEVFFIFEQLSRMMIPRIGSWTGATCWEINLALDFSPVCSPMF